MANASGYEVYMSDKPGKGFKKVLTTKNQSFIRKKLSKNKAYYFKVRAYNNKGRKIVSAFSDVVRAENLSTQRLQNKIVSYRRKYPHGKYWNHVGRRLPQNADSSNYVSNRPWTTHILHL